MTGRQRVLLGVLGVAAITAAGCAPEIASSPSSDQFTLSFVPPEQAGELPAAGPFVEGRPGANGATIFRPTSAAVVERAPYRFSLGHCGLLSPVDVDGAFWDPVDAVGASGRVVDLNNDGEMINQTAGVIILIGDKAFFRTESGTIVRFDRHDGEKAFSGCD